MSSPFISGYRHTDQWYVSTPWHDFRENNQSHYRAISCTYKTPLQSRAVFYIFFFSFCSKWPSGNRFPGMEPFLWFLFGDKSVPTSSSSFDLGMQNIVLFWNVCGLEVKFRHRKELVWSKLWVTRQLPLLRATCQTRKIYIPSHAVSG